MVYERLDAQTEEMIRNIVDKVNDRTNRGRYRNNRKYKDGRVLIPVRLTSDGLVEDGHFTGDPKIRSYAVPTDWKLW